MKTEAYCPTCERDVAFITESNIGATELDGVVYDYPEKRAICPACGNELFYAPYEQAAGLAFNDAVRVRNGIVPLSIVRDLPVKYRIGKRPLSLLLGWGEITYTRFIDGHVPSKNYSETIQRLYDHPEEYLRILHAGKNRVSDITFRKSLAAVQDAMENADPDSLRLLALGDYFCDRACGDISRYWILKLAYYSHAFSLVLCDTPIVNAVPEAWAAGPVYRDLWKSLVNFDREYVNQPIAQVGTLSTFSSDEDRLLDAVYNAFGRYSGTLLSTITHLEGPWVDARNRAQAQPGAKCSEPISLENMRRYFSEIIEKYGIANDYGAMSRYADDMASRAWGIST